jgi:hypothetical protein
MNDLPGHIDQISFALQQRRKQGVPCRRPAIVLDCDPAL